MTEAPSSDQESLPPISASFSTKAEHSSRFIPSSRIPASSPIKAPAAMNVPVSILSAGTWNSPGVKPFTPSTDTVEVPSPDIRAPIDLRNPLRYIISGSRAAFLITVSPSARVAAIRRFAVAPTLGTSKNISAPESLPAVAEM